MEPYFGVSTCPSGELQVSDSFEGLTSVGALSTKRGAPVSFFGPLGLVPILPPASTSAVTDDIMKVLVCLVPHLGISTTGPPGSMAVPPPGLVDDR